MTDNQPIFDSIRVKMEKVGFQLEKEQAPHFQSQRETELKFIHPQLVKKWENDGYSVKATKFYIKQLSDDSDAEIGFVTGKSSPLHVSPVYSKSNAIDTFDGTPAWTNREDDKSLDSLLESIEVYMGNSQDYSDVVDNSVPAFLFTWNPKKWSWNDLAESIDQLESVGYVERRWSCGQSKAIKKGDRIFLMRVGEEPKGIIGSGYAKSSYYVAARWDGTDGKTCHYIDIEFDIILNPANNQVFDKEYLAKTDPENKQVWFPQQSGIAIQGEVVDSLEANWFEFIRKNKYVKNSFVSNVVSPTAPETYSEGRSKDVIQTRYERNPTARKVCLQHHGYSCKICGFNFEDYFGNVGKGFIHVHHINPIAEIGKEYEINPMEDLIPICPNCHAMIHAKRPAFSVEEIIEMRESKTAHDRE
ncbi:HNH endonuclease [anaerobic digester metagenome]